MCMLSQSISSYNNSTDYDIYIILKYHHLHYTVPQSDIELRLVPPQPGLNFLGRLEVLYNNTWGTICDDFFGYAEADIVCHMLNFRRGALCVAGNAKFGRGQGITHFFQRLGDKKMKQSLNIIIQVQFGWIM